MADTGGGKHTLTAILLAFMKMDALFTSRLVTPPPREVISAARSSRNLFCASDLGISPYAKEANGEACELLCGMVVMEWELVLWWW